ncbi:MAG: tRNA pseudouridine(38-40) synthase TruA [Candidatus Aureabacteria bacterium]|nr:tRNA pseudouridine(38-40) synthase TruA [Candidatus Auribacterota bacterium]
METRNIKLVIAYKGTHYHGWQIQKDKITVQGEIQKHLSVLLNHGVVLFGASRTDAGVHALGQTGNFHTTSQKETEVIHHALNKRLPVDIYIKKVQEVPLDFHARKNAQGKHYQYRIWISKEKPVFESETIYWLGDKKIDLESMITAARQIEGTHDFTSFASNAGRKDENKIRTIDTIAITERYPLLVIDVTGVSFLYKMVRGICGTLLEIGRGKSLDIPAILKDRARGSAARNLPPQGLTLMKVFY